MIASVTSRWLARCGGVTSANTAVLTQTAQQVRWGSTSKKLGDKRGTNTSIESMPSMKDEKVSIEDYARTMDTTIPPEKQAHVDKLKKLIRGGSKSVRSLYREVPTPEEMDQLTIPGNFVPKIAPNAREIIDFALMHIPEKGGPRRSKHKKRMALKWKNKEVEDARRKKEQMAAREKRHRVLKKHRALVREVKKEARKLYWPDGTAKSLPKGYVPKKLTSSL